MIVYVAAVLRTLGMTYSKDQTFFHDLKIFVSEIGVYKKKDVSIQ